MVRPYCELKSCSYFQVASTGCSGSTGVLLPSLYLYPHAVTPVVASRAVKAGTLVSVGSSVCSTITP